MKDEITDGQAEAIKNVIYYLELAAFYCKVAWEPAKDSKYALLADLEPEDIVSLIERAKLQHSYIGAEWDIQHSVME